MATTKFSKVQWGDGLTVTPDPDDPAVIRVDGGGGPAGATGPAGPTGATGPAGPGVPTGGSTGQVLTKTSGTDYATNWQTPSGGGGGAPTGAAGGALDGSYPNPGLAASVAGAGLTETSDVLAVNVDGTTLVVASDQVKVNTDGNSGHYLNGAGGWTAPSASVAHLDDVGDVTAPTPADEQVLAWDSGGNNWQPKTAVLKTIADAKGDLVAASGADAMARLPVGSNGQVLAADSTQTLGVKWTTLPGGGMVADTLWDAKGDLAVATAADTGARLPVGSNDQVLVADSAQTTGIKWAAVPSGSGGAMTLLSTTTLGSAGTFDVSSISGGYNDLMVVLMVRGTVSSTVEILALRFNNDSGSNYGSQYLNGFGTSPSANQESAQTSMNVANNAPGGTAAAGVFTPVHLYVTGYASTTWNKAVISTSAFVNDITTGAKGPVLMACLWKSTAAINRIQAFGRGTANLATGSQMRIYGIT